MAIEPVTGTKSSTREGIADSINRGPEVADQIISGTRVISGSSPTVDEVAPPSLIRLEIPNGESLAVYMGIAWSLAFEAGVAAIGYAIWQIWKLF